MGKCHGKCGKTKKNYEYDGNANGYDSISV